MPFFKKNRNYRKRNYRRRARRTGTKSSWGSYLRSGASAIGGMSAVWTAIQALKGKVNSELYKLDVTGSAIGVNTTPGIYHLTAVAQGDGQSARSGNSIFARSLNVRGKIVLDSAGSQSQVRLAVIQDIQQVGDTSPAYTDIYEASNPYCHLNKNTVGRFKVLWTRTLKMTPTSDSAYYNIEINLPMRHHVRYNGTLSSDVQKGGLYLVVLSDKATGYPSMDYESRLSYHDN